MSTKYDVFISHAYEDKDDLVRPLVAWLNQFGLRVWYDEHSLKLGDSLSGSIDRGLVESRFGVVVISPHFLKKAWPEYEYRGLLSREMNTKQEKVVLPLWYNVSRDDVLSFSPGLADKLALKVDGKDLYGVATQILSVVDPEKHKILRRALLKETYQKSLPVEEHPPTDLVRGPIVFHDHLPSTVIWRIRLNHEVFKDVFSRSLEDTIDDFRRDLEYRDELHLWERMAAVYLYIKDRYSLDQSGSKHLFGFLVAASMGQIDENTTHPWASEALLEFNREYEFESGPWMKLKHLDMQR